ncbi:MAG: nodulation protein NfeD, partial [Cytophagales bacterium]|nr:nodulation protein NfeD [Cytophaga sp.]
MKKNSIVLLFICSLLFTAFQVSAQKVMVLKIRDEIDPRMLHYVELGLQAATEQKSDFIVIDMDTYGGTLTDADKIRMLLLDYPKPVYVFINKNAFSAGALIAIACDSIYMASGSSIGAATVVTGEGKPAPDKYQSGMRGLMRTTAEINKRDPKRAESMVGYAVGKDSLTVGNVTVYTTSEAITNGFCEAQLNSIHDLLVQTHLSKAVAVDFELSTTDTIINFFMN